MSNKKYVIEATQREIVGKQVKQLRREGLTPGVIYGQKEPQNIQLDTLTAYLTLRDAGENDLIDLKIGGRTRKVLARDVQRHATRGDLVHIDFLEVDMEHELEAEATIVLVGKSVPEAAGEGITSQLLFHVQIMAKPDDLISEIEVDASQIVEHEDMIHVSDLVVPAGVKIMTDPELAVAKFEYLRQEEEFVDEGEEDVLSSVEYGSRHEADKDEDE